MEQELKEDSMDINVIEEKAKVEQDLIMLQKRLQTTNQQREQIIQQMVMRRGILQYLDSLGGNNELSDNESKPED